MYAQTVVDPPPTFLASLRRWGVLRSTTVEHALEDLPWTALLPDMPGRRSQYYVPWRDRRGFLEPSPRMSVLLVELLELQSGHSVALPVPRPRLLAAIIEALGAQIFDPLRHTVADRSLEIAPAPRMVPLAEGGFALHASFEPHDEGLLKRVRADESDATLRLEKLALRPGEDPPRPIRHALVVEGFCRRALEGKPRTPQDRVFLDAVHATWAPAVHADERDLAAARDWFLLAYIHQFSADLVDAIELYRASIDAAPTSEAHTFLAWALSFTGDIPAAIHECQEAIRVDPSFGNPYNDLGAYYLQLGQPEQALPWFDRALNATRYEAPHFAHCNKGRALLALGQPTEAKAEFERSLKISPGYKPAQEFLSRLLD